MKKLLVALGALGIATTVMPATASAQYGGGYGGWRSINERQAIIDERIDRGIRRGCLTRREAFQLRREFQQIAFLERRYRMSAPGLTRWEMRDLDQRLDNLSRRVRYECRDGDNRWDRRDGYGRDPYRRDYRDRY